MTTFAIAASAVAWTIVAVYFGYKFIASRVRKRRQRRRRAQARARWERWNYS